MSRVADMSLGPRLMGPMLIWLAVMAAGTAAALFATGNIDPVAKIAVGLAVPALLSLLLMPALHRTWSQVVLLALWTGFAVVSTLIGGLFPLAITFLCIPAIAMLFTRERVVEALILAVLALIATFLSLSLVGLGESPLSDTGIGLLAMLGTAGTLALTIAAMIAGTQARDSDFSAVGNGIAAGAWGDAIIGGLLEFGPDDRLVGANEDARAQFGLDRLSEDILLGDMAGGGDASLRMLDTAQLARRSQQPAISRVSIRDSSSTVTSFDMSFTPLSGGGLLLHSLDRTNEAEQLEALRQAQTVAEREAREKTLFFAGVSHELRTPLNAIIGFSDMMRSRLFGPLPGKYAEYADLIHDSGQYMLDLIGDVLDLSKVEAGKYTLVLDTFDVSDVVRSSVKMIRPSADSDEIVVEIDVPDDDVLLITADRKAMRQILLNLLSNAVKFSPKGSTVKISARADEAGEMMLVSVMDEGSGMSAEDIARVGEPFTQGRSGQDADARGSGLGLSLVRSLAELHGGQLDLRSQVGEGTEARVSVPILSE